MWASTNKDVTVLGAAHRPQWEKKNLSIFKSIAHHQMSFQKPDRRTGVKLLQVLSRKDLVQMVSSETLHSTEDISFPAAHLTLNLAPLYLLTAIWPTRLSLNQMFLHCTSTTGVI